MCAIFVPRCCLSSFGFRTIRIIGCLLVAFAITSPHAWAATKAKGNTHRSTSKKAVKKSSKTSSHRKSRRGKKSGRVRGQQAIQSERVREIQEALIEAHYLNGEATGTWDSESKTAMERFQADNGWQTKVVPDSRALIKLGLGPKHDGLLNPESAVVTPHEFAREKDIPGGSSDAK